MANVYSITHGGGMQSSSIDHSRRMYNFGEKVSELAPKQSPFFTYLSKVAKKPTDDPVFKFLEQRHQWQRRNFEVKTAMTSSAHSGSDANFNLTNLQVDCLYDKYGRVVTTATCPNFILEGQMVAIEVEYDANATDAGVGQETAAIAYYKVNAAPDISNAAYAEIDATFIRLVYKPTASVSGAITIASASKLIHRADAKAQIVGSAFAEGSVDPEGW